jgi:hypothetical protein
MVLFLENKAVCPFCSARPVDAVVPRSRIGIRISLRFMSDCMDVNETTVAWFVALALKGQMDY